MKINNKYKVRQTMKVCKAESEIKVQGVDLAKHSFPLYGVDKADINHA
jgi:hypothetical protein